MANSGPADYISLASTFHTFILLDVPVLTLFRKNEARRFISLLDALYEARCRLLISAEAGPDHIFFPETAPVTPSSNNRGPPEEHIERSDSIHAETFSEIHQDQTAPFRANVTSYHPSASPPNYAADITLASTSQTQHVRSILADEDSDFGPLHDVRSQSNPTVDGNRSRSPSGDEIITPNFAQTESFTGQDEVFAYKRAQSRLWEMCGSKWWNREGQWWRPLSREARQWETSAQDFKKPALGTMSKRLLASPGEDERMFPHGASPFRTNREPPPKFNRTHIWGTYIWLVKSSFTLFPFRVAFDRAPT